MNVSTRVGYLIMNALANADHDTGNQTLIESLRKTKLSKLTIFENFNQSCPRNMFGCPAIRVPDPAVSREAAKASLQLTALSASFVVDAGYFLEATRRSW